MNGFTDVALVVFTYLVAHIVVLCIYRVTFHPYAKYPGPVLAKFTGLYGAYYAYTGDIHLDIERCHKKYGKFVRYRPDHLLVNSPEGFHDIYGNGKKFKKSKSYTVHGKTNLIGIMDKTAYAKSKKIFQHGFSDNANREHEPKVVEEVNIFVEKMAENEGSEKNADGWTNPKNMSLWQLAHDRCCQQSDLYHILGPETSTTNRGITETFKTVVRLIGNQ